MTETKMLWRFNFTAFQLVEKVFFDKLTDCEKHTQTLRLP